MVSDPRYDKLSELFVHFSNGDFDFKIDPSEKLDEIDAFISSVNMLGEELKEITISKQFFNNVFDSVSDLIFILDIDGHIKKVNKTVNTITRLNQEELIGVHIDVLFFIENKSFFKEAIKKTLKNNQGISATFYYSSKSSPILCSLNGFYDELNNHLGYIFFVKDLSSLKKIENSLKLSEEKYRKLFEESGDAIAIVNNKGKFIEINSAGRLLFGFEKIIHKNQSIFKNIVEKNDIEKMNYSLNSNNNFHDLVIKIRNKLTKNFYSCLVSSSKLSDSNNYLIILKDISDQIEMENLVIRTIVDTQENERKRFARDIHDSLGQQLSAVKFYLSTLNSKVKFDEKNKIIIDKTEDALRNILASIREICFNLMPKSIESFGLTMAINELCNTIQLNGEFDCIVYIKENFPRLSHEKELAIFRIIQEFINNAVKHSKGNKINIDFNFSDGEVDVLMKDNGVGFDKNKTKNKGGMGLKNIESRARSYNGTLKISSKINQGTKYHLIIPIN